MSPAHEPVHFQRYSLASGWEQAETQVITEASVDLSVNGETWLSFACTPLKLEPLAVGFLYNEGFIQRREEIVAVHICAQGTNIDVWLNHVIDRPAHWQRTAGCTGGFTTASHNTVTHPAWNGERVAPKTLLACMEQLLQSQELYRATGGVHTSAISDGQTIRLQAEDIGRHNTLDKLAGQMLMEDLRIQPLIVMTTGRISAEMLQKSARMGAAVVISRTSPTSQSVAQAEQAGITLVGYARRNGFIIYTHAERVRP